MKQRSLLTVVAVLLAGSVAARADLLYTFDTDIGPDFTQNVAWSANLGGSAQSTMTSGGWTLGSGPQKEFSWQAGGGAANQQTTMQEYANNAANYRVAFDVTIDGTSFSVAGSDWFNLQIAGNSDGTAGWSQQQFASGWHNDGDTALYSWHGDYSFADVGWEPGDNWFQIAFGVQTGTIPIDYYVDNLSIYQVPEPATLALIGIGTVGLLTFRRRH